MIIFVFLFCWCEIETYALLAKTQLNVKINQLSGVCLYQSQKPRLKRQKYVKIKLKICDGLNESF